MRCKNGKEEWDLDDYERWESKERKEVKIVSNHRELGIMPLSPHAKSKTMSLSGKRNVKSTKLQKKNIICNIRPSMPKSKELELSPIPKSTDSLNAYDWNTIHRKLLQSKSFYELKLIAENELNKVPPLSDRFVGDKSLSGDTIDNVAMKFFPADTTQ